MRKFLTNRKGFAMDFDRDDPGTASLTGKGATAFLEFVAQYPTAEAVEVILQSEIGKFFRIRMNVAQWNRLINFHENNENVFV